LGADVAIDVLINHAQGESPLYSKKVNQGGVAERATTEDGFDRIIGTAHLSHFALVAALLPALKRSRRAACSNAAPGLYQLGYAAARYPRLLGVAAQARGRAR
jgi:NAD(P)-dependent dehydrogenase (short-subunit alcohol dehydrogenase family)